MVRFPGNPAPPLTLPAATTATNSSGSGRRPIYYWWAQTPSAKRNCHPWSAMRVWSGCEEMRVNPIIPRSRLSAVRSGYRGKATISVNGNKKCMCSAPPSAMRRVRAWKRPIFTSSIPGPRYLSETDSPSCGNKGYREVLAEGGGILNHSLLREDLVDRLFLTLAPAIFGGQDTPSLCHGPRLRPMSRFELVSCRSRESELHLEYQRKS